MKYILSASAALLTAVNAHSWLECVDYDNSQILPWMKANASMGNLVDPGMPWFSQEFCKAYPRNKQYGGNWIEESTNYIWNIAAQSFNMNTKPADTHACHPSQRSPSQLANAPMAKKAPGESFKLYYGGNGHTRGANCGGSQNPNPGGPGTVKVYWKGAPEQEITDISEFTQENLLQSNGFADESFSYPEDPNVKSPTQGLVDKGNWQTIQLPNDIAPGRHMFVWVWYYAGQDGPQWSTCFDVEISGDAKAANTAAKPDYNIQAAAAPAAAPAADYKAAEVAPAAPVITPAPAPAKAAEMVVETVYETVDVWTTVWDYQKRNHIRQFKQ